MAAVDGTKLGLLPLDVRLAPAPYAAFGVVDGLVVRAALVHGAQQGRSPRTSIRYRRRCWL